MTIESYKFYFKNDEQSVAADVLECDGDADAVQQAKQLLSVTQFEIMEIWQGSRKVGVIERNLT
jgi:hypothetical protein